MKRIITALVLVTALVAAPYTANAETDKLTVSSTLINVYTYYDTVEISAYYPGEDGYHTNHRDIPLTELVDSIIATQTRGGHAELLGKTVMLVTPDGERLFRKVDDRGCYKGRLDLLVENRSAMNEWGLVDCEVWVLEENSYE